MPVIIPAATADPCRGPLRCKKVIDAHCVQVDGVIPCMSGVTNPYVDNVLRYYCTVLQNLSNQIASLQSDGIQTIKIPLTSSQILQLNSVPILAIPTPGAGKAIQVISAFEEYSFNSAVYITNTTVILTAGSGGSLIFQDIGDVLSSGTSTSSYLKVVPGTGGVPANTGIYASVLTANPGGGNGTLNLYISYQIITL